MAIRLLFGEPHRMYLLQLLEQRVLALLELLCVEVPELVLHLELTQLAPDPRLGVELLRRLLRHLLADPRHTANRRERQRQKSRDQAHACASVSDARSTKLCGGSGPR